MASLNLPSASRPDATASLLPPTSPRVSDISVLHSSHARPLKKAIKRVLDAAVAEISYAQVIDGLPTRESLCEFQVRNNQEHPVIRLDHNDICAIALAKAREFRANFDVLSLNFSLQLLLAYQDTTPHTDPETALRQSGSHFYLRLIELVAVACHQIAVLLYQLEAGPHHHSEYAKWRDGPREDKEPERLPSVFCHNSYTAVAKYPNGVADCAGYWAEAKIFGGVVLFDRVKKETNTFFLHPSLLSGPRTIYAPTVEQFTDLLNFLLHPDDDDDDVAASRRSPLPMTASMANRYRWDPWEAMVLYDIYRDPYERRVPTKQPRRRGCARSTRDFPEEQDEHFQLLDMFKPRQGIQVDEEEARNRDKRMRQITPSSPLWPPGREYKGVVLGRDDDDDDDDENNDEGESDAWDGVYAAEEAHDPELV